MLPKLMLLGTIELYSLVCTNSGVARPIIENDNEVSCMMDEDKLTPEVYVTIYQKEPTDYPIVCTDETIHDQENSQASDIDKSDDVSIPDVDTNNSDDGVGAGSASAGPSGFATFGEGSFGEDGLDEDGSGEHPTSWAWTIPESKRYSLEPNLMGKAISNDNCLYKGSKKDLKHTVHMYALNENFELRTRRSSKTCYEAGCKDGECEFQLRAFKMRKGEYWVVRMFVMDHTCNIDGFHARFRQANSWTVGELLAPKLKVHGHSLKPKDIMVEMQLEHGLHLLYSKAWRAKDLAEASVFSAPEESFKLLPAYCHRLKEDFGLGDCFKIRALKKMGRRKKLKKELICEDWCFICKDGGSLRICDYK
ncbi:hypothetical protein EZV62_018930 [Acer yangbiense]|uniref:Uncharacterized protein n=1 Tax=Acer yangbiense TaxID=1000413 RepID=A0A5C7H9Q6_9ROSI|nr:hypothetical protein EZV62_018930 [Acer yangbiense]